MRDRLIRRRELLATSVTAGLVGTAGCLRKQQPDASHWAAGFRWSDPPGEAYREMGFSPSDGSYFTGPLNAKFYYRVNGGELQRWWSKDDPVSADRGDHVEFIIDFDTWRQGKETVFEYTIPDGEDLTAVLAGFAECLHYRNTDEWVVRPLNVDLGTDLFGRPRETLVVTVRRERGDEYPDWFAWGPTESIREGLHEQAAWYDGYDEVEIEFFDPGEEATFRPAAFHLVGMRIFDGDEWVAGFSFPNPFDDS